MPSGNAIRSYLIELVVVFVGVALAFAVENLREDLNEQAVGEQYQAGFRSDLLADLEMLNFQLGQLIRPDGACPIHELDLEYNTASKHNIQKAAMKKFFHSGFNTSGNPQDSYVRDRTFPVSGSKRCI